MTLAIYRRAAVKTLRGFEDHMPKHSGYEEHKNAVDSVEEAAQRLDEFATSHLSQFVNVSVASPRSRRRGKPQ